MISVLVVLSSVMAPPGLAGDADRILAEHRAAGELPGVSAAIVLDGDIVYRGAAGVADLETGREMTVDTPLYAGSLSKVFTAVLVLDQVDQGAIRLDSRPALDAPVDGASVVDLMTHTAGLSREGDFGYWFSGDFPGNAELTAYFRRTTLAASPGSNERYSNLGYALLGLMLEEVRGKPYGQLLRERVLMPLGLAGTGIGRPPELSRGYSPPGRLLPSDERPFAGVGAAVGNRRLREYHDARAMTPAFGLYSTSRDLATLAGYVLALDRGAAAVERAGPALLREGDSGRSLVFGLRTLHGRQVATHGGWFAAHRSYLLLDPEARVGIAVMTNSDDGRPGLLVESLHRLFSAGPKESRRP